MKRSLASVLPPELESLLAAERTLVREPEEVRERAVERARAALDNPALRADPTFAKPARPWRGALLAAAVVSLGSLFALAFLAGYFLREQRGTETTSVSSFPTTVILLPTATVEPTAPEELPIDTALPPPPSVQPAVAPRAVTEIESYALELAVLQPAQRALSGRDFPAVLGAVTEHQRRFPTGKLTEEREALRIKALLGLGRKSEAVRAGAAFHRRFPESALLSRIDSMLETTR